MVLEPGHLATYRRINQALWQEVEKGTLTPSLVKVRRFELLLEALRVAFSPAVFSASYLECLANARNWSRMLRLFSERCTGNIALPSSPTV